MLTEPKRTECEIVGTLKATLLKNETEKMPVSIYDLKRSSALPERSVSKFSNMNVRIEYE